jgi:hypothetical protein
VPKLKVSKLKLDPECRIEYKNLSIGDLFSMQLLNRANVSERAIYIKTDLSDVAICLAPEGSIGASLNISDDTYVVERSGTFVPKS